MQTISVVRNAGTISLTTITEKGVVCVDIPLPSDIGKSAVIRSGCLNLSAPNAEITNTKSNLENRNTIGTDVTVYAMPALQDQHQDTWKEYFVKCGKRTFRKQKQDTGVHGDIANHNPKKKSTKSIRGEKKTS